MEKNNPPPFLERIRIIINRVEDGILVSLLLVMIVLAVAQIFLRNLFGSGIIWGDVLLRIMVLWIGLFGAMIGSRDDKHIHIELFARYLPEKVKTSLTCVIYLVTTFICLIVAWFAIQYIRMEILSGEKIFSGVPAWAGEIIIPFAFIVIALRYFILTLINFKKFLKPIS